MDEPPSFDSFPSGTSSAPSHVVPPSFDSFPDLPTGGPSQPTVDREPRSKREKSKSDRHGARKDRKRQCDPGPSNEVHPFPNQPGLEPSPRSSTDPAIGFLNSLSLEFDKELAGSKGKRIKTGKSKPKINHVDKVDAPKRRKTDLGPPAPNLLAQSLYSIPEEKKLFCVDLREDTFNLHHGRPDKAKVPNYRRLGGMCDALMCYLV